VDALRRRAVGQVGQQPGGHAAGDPEGLRQRPGVQVLDDADRRGGAEDAADRGGVEAAQVEGVAGGQADATGDLVAGDQGGQQPTGRRPGAGLGGGQRGGDDDGADVADRRAVRVVEVQRVDRDAVGQGGARGVDAVRDPDRRRRATAAARAGGATRELPSVGRFAQAVGGQAAPQRVEQVQARGVADDLRDVRPPQAGGEGRQPGRGRVAQEVTWPFL
jgi:hypothetical protein